MQRSTPRLMLAQRGSGCPQSPHWPLPATPCTRCSTLSPLALRSRVSVAESMLLVDGDAVRSSLWETKRGHSVLPGAAVSTSSWASLPLSQEGQHEPAGAVHRTGPSFYMHKCKAQQVSSQGHTSL